MSKDNTYTNCEVGSARFAEAEEIRESSTEIFLDGDCSCGGVPLFTDGKHLWVDGKDTNTLCVSTPGGGKSRRVCTPILLSDIAAGNSIIVTDPKGELLKSTYSFLQNHGYNIRCINFRDPSKGNRWNPLFRGAMFYKNGREDLAAEAFTEIGHCIYQQIHSEKDPYWEISAENTFAGYALLACNHVEPEEVTLGLIYRMFLDGEKKLGGTTYLEDYLSHSDSEILRQALSGLSSAPRETRGSIDSVFVSQLSKLIINKSIDNMLSGESFAPEDFAEKKTALFICLRDECSTYSTLVSLLVHEIYSGLIDYAEKNGGKLQKTVDFVLDEFSNFPKIIDMDNKISSCRSRNIRFYLFIQSLYQMKSVYGEDIAQTLLNCCDNWMMLQSRDMKILQQFSERCGDVYGKYSQEKRPLLSAASIQHLSKKDGEVLFLYGAEYPYVAELVDRSVYLEKLGIEELKEVPTINDISQKIEKDFGLQGKEKNFSLKEYVDKTRDDAIKKLMEPDDKKEDKAIRDTMDSMIKNNPQGIDVADLVSRIDAKIAELEAEECENEKKAGEDSKDVEGEITEDN